MLSALTTFAAGESKFHISLKAEEVFSIGDFVVTNAIVYGVFVAVAMSLIMLALAKRSKVSATKGPVVIIEILVGFIVDLLESTFNSKKKAYKYAPVFGTFFLFIIFNNIAGIIPIVGPGIEINDIPVFRPFTADLNGTLVMSLIAIGYVQYLSVKEQGLKGHFQHYFTDKPLNPINMFVGIIEVFGELTRVLSLSLRLFLNTAVGEILIAAFTSLVIADGRTPLVAIPIFLFEILVAGIQAYVFTVLSATYLSLATAHSHDEEDHEPEALKVEELQPGT